MRLPGHWPRTSSFASSGQSDARWWVAIGVSIGYGMLCKWTMGFFAVGIVAGVLLTDARRYLKSKWLWMGVALSLLIFLPNVIWQIQNHWISLDMLKHIHARDIRQGRTAYFLPQQLELTGVLFPLALAGLYFYFRAPEGKRFRMIGWMYIVTLVIFIVLRGTLVLHGAGVSHVVRGRSRLGRRLAGAHVAWSSDGGSRRRVGSAESAYPCNHRILYARGAAWHQVVANGGKRSGRPP